MKPRKVQVAVISDLHLATRACNAKIVLKYLKSIAPELLVLNGDIIDSWRFSRNYFPKSHLKVVRHFIKMMEKGTKIFYITGNHDEFLRKFDLTRIGNLSIGNQLMLELDGQKTWIFHGDIFDRVIHHAKWLAKLGAASYGMISVVNQAVNGLLRLVRKKDILIYKSIKERLSRDQTTLTRTEQLICEVASKRSVQTVICGHTHSPKDQIILSDKKAIRYINCGDWVENFTSAEYTEGKWNLVRFSENEDDPGNEDMDIPDKKAIYHSLIRELSIDTVSSLNFSI